MPRFELQEIHDDPRFPAFLRDLVTDALEALWEFGNTYRIILVRLSRSIQQSGTTSVVDLCSGGGGPWPRLLRQMEEWGLDPVRVCLTDKFPNFQAFQRARKRSPHIAFAAKPVEAAHVPDELKGFRTIFSSFHHMEPEEAKRILMNAAKSGQGIGIFEAARRSPRTMATICVIPLLSLVLAPFMRPFRIERLVWTWLLPVVPLVLLYDGLASCLRVYSQDDLQTMIGGIANQDYEWQCGEDRGGWLPVTYLIGCPVVRQPDV